MTGVQHCAVGATWPGRGHRGRGGGQDADWLFELQGDETGGGPKQGGLEGHPFGSLCPK